MQKIIFNIKSIRKSKNISIYKLSKLTNISRAYLSNLERNKVSNPTANILLTIADALNVNVKELFYTDFDVEDLRNKMHESIDIYGLSSPEVLKISQLIDLIMTIDINKNKE